MKKSPHSLFASYTLAWRSRQFKQVDCTRINDNIKKKIITYFPAVSSMSKHGKICMNCIRVKLRDAEAASPSSHIDFIVVNREFRDFCSNQFRIPHCPQSRIQRLHCVQASDIGSLCNEVSQSMERLWSSRRRAYWYTSQNLIKFIFQIRHLVHKNIQIAAHHCADFSVYGRKALPTSTTSTRCPKLITTTANCQNPSPPNFSSRHPREHDFSSKKLMSDKR